MNKQKFGGICLIFLSLLVVGCSKSKEVETTKSSSSHTEQISTTKESETKQTSESTTQSESISTTSSETTIESTESSESTEPTDLDKYNALTEQQKVLLIVSQYDQRAKEVGMHVWYSFDNGYLYVQVHSGAGVGHPVYELTYDERNVFPKRSYVNTGFQTGIEELTTFYTPYTKENLYKNYLAEQGAYDAALVNVQTFAEGSMPTMTNDKFTEVYNMIGQKPTQ